MTNNFKISLLILTGLMTTACPLLTRQQEEEQEKQQMKQQVAEIQKTKADSAAQLSDLQNDVRVIAGRVDALEHQRRQERASDKAEIEQLRNQVASQNEKIRLLEDHVLQSEQKLLAAMQTTFAVPAGGDSDGKPAKAKKEDKKAAAKKSSDDPFDEAESLFKSKDYKKAIVKYEAYREKNPKGAKAAEATYKIGVSFDELGMRKDAKEFYQEVVEKHAGSKSAKKAKFRLNQMK